MVIAAAMMRKLRNCCPPPGRGQLSALCCPLRGFLVCAAAWLVAWGFFPWIVIGPAASAAGLTWLPMCLAVIPYTDGPVSVARLCFSLAGLRGAGEGLPEVFVLAVFCPVGPPGQSGWPVIALCRICQGVVVLVSGGGDVSRQGEARVG